MLENQFSFSSIDKEKLSPRDYLEKKEGCVFYTTFLENHPDVAKKIYEYKKRDLSYIKNDKIRENVMESVRALIKYLEGPIVKKDFTADREFTVSDKYHEWRNKIRKENPKAYRMLVSSKWRSNSMTVARGGIEMIIIYDKAKELSYHNNIKKILIERLGVKKYKGFGNMSDNEKLELIGEMEKTVVEILDLVCKSEDIK